MAKQSVSPEDARISLPLDGLSRWRQIEPFSPVSREKFRQLVNEGRAPSPIRLGERTTCYQNRELHKFFADPINYRAAPVSQAT